MAIELEKTLTFQKTPDDSVDVYDMARLIRWEVDLAAQEVVVRFEFGTSSGSDFTPGLADNVQFVLENRSAHIGPGGVEVSEDLLFDELQAAGFTEDAICKAVTQSRSGVPARCAGTVVAAPATILPRRG